MLVKKSLLLFIILLLPFALAEDPSTTTEPSGLTGELLVSADISQETVFSDITSNAIHASDHFDVVKDGLSVGRVSITYDLQNIPVSHTSADAASIAQLKRPNLNEQTGDFVFNYQDDSDKFVFKRLQFNNVPISASTISIVNENLDLLSGPSFDIVLDGSVIGSLSVWSIRLFSNADFLESDKATFDLTHSSPDGQKVKVGQLTFDASNIDLTELAFATNTFHGSIKSTTGELLRKGLLCVVKEGSSDNCINVFDGTYIVTIKGRDKDKIGFKFNGIGAGTKLLDAAMPSVLFDLQIDTSSVNFGDDDKDGLPNFVDKCPDSLVPDIDINGCDCSQKKCPVGSMCQTNFFQGNRCVSKPLEQCKEIRQCLNNAPKYCNPAGVVINNCFKCGCPEGFTCAQSGSCVKVLTGLVGTLCKDNDFFYSLNKITCPKGWIEEDLRKYLSFSVKAPPIIKDRIKKKVRHRLNAITLCLKTNDLGCAPPDQPYKCQFEDLFDKNRDKAARIVEENIGNNIPSPHGFAHFIKEFGELFGAKFKVKPHVDLSGFSLRIPYGCPPKLVTSDNDCTQMVYNGPADKRVDLVFVGAGYFDDSEFEREVWDMLDYEGKFAGTEKEGLFSIEPFKSSKAKFNIWVVNGKDSIRHRPSAHFLEMGLVPSLLDVNEFASKCPFKDHAIIVTKHNHRSHCFPKGDCFLSVAGTSYKGRLLLHEFGHGFASLEDEYANEAPEFKNAPNRIEDLVTEIRTDAANCKPDEAAARLKWGDLVDNNIIGFFKPCGGDCLPHCKDAVRPTQNSIMRHEAETKGNPPTCQKKDPTKPDFCKFGPPFDPYYAVNEREILKELDKYEAGDPQQTFVWRAA